MSRVHLAALALATCVLAVSGCGGSSKTGSTSGTPSATASATTASPTNAAAGTTPSSGIPVTVTIASGKPLARARWISKGEAICTKVNAKLDASPIRTKADLGRVAPQTAAYRHAEVAQLAKLVPPPSKASDWREFLNGTQQVAQAVAKLGEIALTGKNIIKLPMYQQTQAVQERISLITKHDGFTQCALG